MSKFPTHITSVRIKTLNTTV